MDKLPIVVKLAYPVKLGEEEVSELTFTRRPTGADVQGLRLPLDADGYKVVISRLIGRTTVLTDRMDLSDLVQAVEVVANFLIPGQRTGSGS